MFADEYLTASFPEVCSVLEDAVASVVDRPEMTGLRASGPLRYVSSGVASLHLDWRDRPPSSGWSAGEVRVLQVQSGMAPRTELMVAAPSGVPTAAAREFLEVLAAAIQRALALALPA